MDHDKFNKIAGGVQSIVIAIAAIVGGGWALYQFHTLHQAEKARLDIEDLKSKQPVLTIELVASPIQVPATRGFGRASFPQAKYLEVVASVHNSGTANTYLDMKHQPLDVERILDPMGTALSEEVPVSGLSSLESGDLFLCRAGETARFAFLARIHEPGLYQISFNIPAEASELQTHAADPAVLSYEQATHTSWSVSGTWSETVYYVVPASNTTARK